MIKIAPKPLVCLNDWVQGEGRKKWGIKKRETQTFIFQSGVLDANGRRKYVHNSEIPFHRKGRGPGISISSHDMNGGSYKRMNEKLKWKISILILRHHFCQIWFLVSPNAVFY